jgi:hypothetical protein
MDVRRIKETWLLDECWNIVSFTAQYGVKWSIRKRRKNVEGKIRKYYRTTEKGNRYL